MQVMEMNLLPPKLSFKNSHLLELLVKYGVSFNFVSQSFKSAFPSSENERMGGFWLKVMYVYLTSKTKAILVAF